MKVAIIGGGISGLMVADQIDGLVDYTLFEKSNYLGGHTNTHTVTVDAKEYTVDTGFIVCNRSVYRRFFEMLDKYAVKTQSTEMSFAVNNLVTGLEYNATNLSAMFCQKKNLFNLKFYRMIYDILRFYRNAPKILDAQTDISLHDYLTENKYSEYFIEEHIVPMASALWSGDFKSVKQFPINYLLSFMDNHQMLQVSNRPKWETVVGGSWCYVKSLQKKLTGELLINCGVNNVQRSENNIIVHTSRGEEAFDYVFFASHSDQTLALIESPSLDENFLLSNISYVENVINLHTDASIMPKNKKAWASWCVNKYPGSTQNCTVNYYMNMLQNIDCPQPLIVSLNQSDRIDKNLILKTIRYQHPVYTKKTIKAQKQKQQIQGKNRSYFCGAYWGWGFHEDGAKSAVEAVEQFRLKVLA